MSSSQLGSSKSSSITNCPECAFWTEPQVGGVYIWIVCCDDLTNYAIIYLNGSPYAGGKETPGCGGVYSDIGYTPGENAVYRVRVFDRSTDALLCDSGDLPVTYGS